MFDESPAPTAADAAPDDAGDPSDRGDPSGREEPAARRFDSCRWRKTQQNGGAPYCGHRDVLPYAGMNGFRPDSWCPDCGLFKARRTVKKRAGRLPDDY